MKKRKRVNWAGDPRRMLVALGKKPPGRKRRARSPAPPVVLPRCAHCGREYPKITLSVPCEPFCSSRCALTYARHALAAKMSLQNWAVVGAARRYNEMLKSRNPLSERDRQMVATLLRVLERAAAP